MSRRQSNSLHHILPYTCSVFLLLCVLSLAVRLPAQDEQKAKKGGAGVQPSDTTATSTSQTSESSAGSGTSADDSKSLLSAKDVKLLAVVKCATAQVDALAGEGPRGGAETVNASASASAGESHPTKPSEVVPACPLEAKIGYVPRGAGSMNASLADILARNAAQPLTDGNDTDTAVSRALKALLNLEYFQEAVFDAKSQYAVIHLVDRQGASGEAKQAATDAKSAAGGKKGTTPSPATTKEDPDNPTPKATTAENPNSEPFSRWILAHRTKKGIELSEEKRMMGVNSISVIFIHVNAMVDEGRDVFDVFGEISYRGIAKEKLPANVEHLLGILRVAGAVQAKTKTPPKYAIIGFGSWRKLPVPSDLTVFGVEPKTSGVKLIGQSSVYDNEGKHMWDASIGVPVNKISLLDYVEEDKNFVPKTINKQSIYGMINVYPWPVDIKSGSARFWVPRVLLGLGLTGRPGENFMIGAGWGIPQLQFFVGSGFANQRVLNAGATDTTNGSNYHQRYASRLTYGINVPVMSTIKKLTSKSGTADTSSAAAAPAKSETKSNAKTGTAK